MGCGWVYRLLSAWHGFEALINTTNISSLAYPPRQSTITTELPVPNLITTRSTTPIHPYPEDVTTFEHPHSSLISRHGYERHPREADLQQSVQASCPSRTIRPRQHRSRTLSSTTIHQASGRTIRTIGHHCPWYGEFSQHHHLVPDNIC